MSEPPEYLRALARYAMDVPEIDRAAPRSDGVRVLFDAARFALLRHDESGAEEYLRRAISEAPALFQLHLLLGVILFERAMVTRDPETSLEALETLALAAKQNPMSGEAHLRVGKCLAAMGSPHAELSLATAVQCDPSLREARLELACHLFWGKREYARALQEFEALMEAHPTWLEAYDRANFYELYLQGSSEDLLAEHFRGREKRTEQYRKRLGIDRLKLRTITGVAPFIGHYAYLDDIIKAQELGLLEDAQRVVLTQPGRIANRHLLSYWERYLLVLEDPEIVNGILPFEELLSEPFVIPNSFIGGPTGDRWRDAVKIQEEWTARRRAPLLSVNAEDRALGENTLRQMGIPEDGWFVALHVRDDGFKGPDPKHALRNADIDSYVPAMREITSRGGYVIRMGDAKMKPCPSLPGVIDYARSPHKSQAMDVFLWGCCRFFIGGNSGPTWIPRSFGVPVLMVNWTPITRHPWDTQSLLLPKRFARFDGTLLSLRETVDPRGVVSWTHSSDGLASREVGWIDNSPEELRAATVEMLARCDGTATYTPGDEAKQTGAAAIIREVSEGAHQGDRTVRLAKVYLDAMS